MMHTDDKVDVWEIETDRYCELFQEYLHTLSEEEKERAGRFVKFDDCQSFVITHGALRIILSRYLEMPPQHVVYHYDEFGKPSVRSTKLDLHFNLSHSEQKAVVAVSIGTRVGVDLERVVPFDDYEQIAHQHFTKQEVISLKSVEEDQRSEAFYRLWTRKEAFMKGIGIGLSQSLDWFDVSRCPEQPVQIMSDAHAKRPPQNWYLHEFSPWPDYLACLAVEGIYSRCNRLEFVPH